MSTPGFFSPLRTADRKSTIIWLTAILLMTIHIYEGSEGFFVKHFGDDFAPGPLLNWYKWLYRHAAALFLFGVIPALIVKFWLKECLCDYGFRVGDWKFGLKATLIAFIVLPLPMYIGSKNPEFREFYPLTTLATESPFHFFLWGLSYLPLYIGWEFFFRGYIGMGLRHSATPFGALMAQVAFTTLLHIGKPEGETWSSLFGGIYLGLLTYRTGSVLWAMLFHFYLGMMNTWFASLPL